MTMPKQPPGKRIGQGMWVLFWCLAMVALALLFAEREEQLWDPNRQLRTNVSADHREIQLNASRLGHYRFPGTINGTQVNLLIDTGATEVVVPEKLAKNLNLERGRGYSVRTANGDIQVYRTHIALLELGPIQLRNVSASINPHMDGEVLLGMSALRYLELTQSNGQLVLRQRLR